MMDTVEKSWASSGAVRRNMQANRSRDTGPELAVRRELHRRGLRFRTSIPVPGMPRRTIDIGWRTLRIAVFVDGCFWHGCQEHVSHPATNADYWIPKIVANQERDSETQRHLEGSGWIVLRCWEHEDPAVVAEEVVRIRSMFNGHDAGR